jgi:hypothetical protein
LTLLFSSPKSPPVKETLKITFGRPWRALMVLLHLLAVNSSAAAARERLEITGSPTCRPSGRHGRSRGLGSSRQLRTSRCSGAMHAPTITIAHTHWCNQPSRQLGHFALHSAASEAACPCTGRGSRTGTTCTTAQHRAPHAQYRPEIASRQSRKRLLRVTVCA